MARWPALQLFAAKALGAAVGVILRWWVFIGFTVLVLVTVPVQLIVRPAHGLELWSSLFAVFIVLLLVVGLVRLRTHLVIETLADHRATGPEEGRVPARALATMLSSELDALMGAHRRTTSAPAEPDAHSDELQTQTGATRALQPILGTAEIGTFLQSAVSPESQIALGPLKLSLRPLVALAARLAQGKRLAGSIVGDEHSLEVTVQLVQGGTPTTWRVERRSATPGAPEVQMVTDMMRELAARIFTDLVTPGTRQWRATRAFVEGLNCYRECLPKPGRRPLQLRKAADHFLDAIHIDPNFTLARYNLGIVYEAMERSTGMISPETAESVFMEAVARDPACWFTQYALARHRFLRAEENRARLLGSDASAGGPSQTVDSTTDFSVVGLCDRVLQLQRMTTEAWARTHLLRARAMIRAGSVEEAAAACAAARRATWFWLLRASLWRRNRLAVTAAATAVCAEAFARDAVRLRGGDDKRALALFRHSLALEGGSVTTLYAYARTCVAEHDLAAAEKALITASGIQPDNASVLALLALVRAGRQDAFGCVTACDRFLSHVTGADDEDLTFVERALHDLWTAALGAGNPIVRRGAVARGQRLLSVRRARTLAADSKANRPELRRLFKSSAGDLSAGGRWFRGYTAQALGGPLLDRAREAPQNRRLSALAAAYLRQSLDSFGDLYSAEAQKLNVERGLAEAEGLLGHYRQAVDLLATAQIRNPLDADLSYVRGRLFAQFDDDVAATSEYRRALDASGDDYRLHAMAGIAYYSLAVSLVEPGARLGAQQKAVHHLRAALELSPWDDPLLPGLHGSLGGVFFQWGQYVDARFQLQAALRIDPDDVGTWWLLGETLLRMHDLSKSRSAFQALVSKTEHRPPTEVTKGWMSMPAAHLLALAHSGLAHLLAEADGSLEGVGAHLDQALAAAEQMSAGDDRVEVFARFLDVAGWVSLKSGNVDEALRRLRESVAMNPEPETYWHLACAYRAAAQRQHRARARIPLWDKVIDTSLHARYLAIADEFIGRIDALRAHAERERARDAKQARAAETA